MIFENFLKFVTACILIFTLGIMASVVDRLFDKANLMRECLNDGHKSYECEGIIKGCRGN